MINLPKTLPLPMKMDKDGNVRISGTRVTLHTLIHAYLRGDNPQNIHEGFPTIPLADIHAVIAYYLANQESVDAHMRAIDAEGKRWRQFWEARNPPPTRAELEARLVDKKDGAESDT